MADELNDGAPAPATEDTRSTIIAAIERQRNPEPAADPVVKDATADAPVTDKPAESADGRVRDEHGRFKPAEKAADGTDKPAEAVAAAPVTKEAAKADEAPATTDAAPVARPPVGWSATAKAAFDALPEPVRAAVAKREVEVNQGLAKLAEYRPIERFVDMAKQGGTTLETALTAYTNMENVFRRDPIAGVEQVCQNLRIDPRALFAEMSRRYTGQAPAAQPQQGQSTQGQQALNLPPELIQKLTGLETTVAAFQREREQAQMDSVSQNIDAFFDDPKNMYANNVAPLMASLINMAKANGEKINLPAIYEQACWLDPEVKELLINEQLATRTTAAAASNPAAKAQAAATQARQAAKAVTGAPSGGSPPSSAPPANESIRQTILRAVAEQKGA